MYVKWQLASFIFLFFASQSNVNLNQKRENVPVDKNLQVFIKHGLSNKVDLMNGIYTVNFIGKPPLEVKFSLTPAEKEQIINKYYSLALYELKEVDNHWGTIYLEDECMIMPKIYTYLTVVRDSATQQIQIDEACDDYSSGRSDEPERVKAFLQLVDEIIQKKTGGEKGTGDRHMVCIKRKKPANRSQNPGSKTKAE